MLRRHAHARSEDWRGRSRTVRSTGGARVVLRASPAEADARVTDGVALHLVDGHLGGVALHELDKTTALARRDLDVGNLAEALEERTELVLGDVAAESADEDSGIVRVGELVHGLGSAVVAHRRSAHGVHAHSRAAALLHIHAARAAGATALVLGGRSTNAHRSVSTVHTLHLGEGLLLVLLVGETNEAVAARHAADGVGHDLGRLGGCVLVLEKLDKNELGDLGAEISNEDGVLGATLIAAISMLAIFGHAQDAVLLSLPAISQAAAGGPVELEGTVGVRNELAVEAQGLGRSVRAGKVNEAVSGVTAAQISLRDNTPPPILALTRRICRGSS